MFCPKCGTQLEDFEAFCHSCGYRVTEEAPATSVAQEPVFPAASASQEPAPAAQEEEVVVPKKKSKKKLIIGITAAVTALAVGIGAVAFYFVNHPKVYLRTKVTKYDENGDVYKTIEYQYNDQGSPTEIKETTLGYDYSEKYNGQGMFYVTEPDGSKEVGTYTYEYNEQGHCVSYEELYEKFNADGKRVEKIVCDSTEAWDYKYHYNDDGTIDTIEYRAVDYTSEGYTSGDYQYESVYHYNDKGQLHEISFRRLGGEYEYPENAFRYDSKGRLIESYYCYGSTSLYEYAYDKDGNLVGISRSQGENTADLGKKYTFDDLMNGLDFSTQYETEFEYDEKGRLISREVFDGVGNAISKVELEHDGKFVSCVEYEDYEVQITDDEDEADRIAKKMGEDDVVMVRDKYGNIIKVIYSNGSYAEFEYEAVRLPKKLAQQHSSIMYSVRRNDLLIYESSSVKRYTGGCGVYSYVAFPTDELYEIERILDEARLPGWLG